MEIGRVARGAATLGLRSRVTLLGEALLVSFGALLVAALAQLTIPLRPVPITGQTLGVLLVGTWLGRRRGTASLLAYLALGAAGAPVFAGGRAGLGHLLGPTGGYLIGFVLSAYAVGALAERGWLRHPLACVGALLLGTLLIYGPGLVWLAQFVGWGEALEVGFKPFLFGDTLKAVVAALVLPWGWALRAAILPCGSPE